MYIHVHECKYMYGHGTDMSVQIHNHTSHSITQFTCNCMYVFEHCMYIVHTCLDMVQTCFTQSTTFKQCCTSFRQCYGTGICHLVHTVFRHVHTPQEQLWQVVSFPAIFHNWVQTCLFSVQTLLYNVQHLTETILKKCHRKPYHLPEPFLRCIYMSEHCMYRMANSCTIALFEAGSVQ